MEIALEAEPSTQHRLERRTREPNAAATERAEAHVVVNAMERARQTLRRVPRVVVAVERIADEARVREHLGLDDGSAIFVADPECRRIPIGPSPIPHVEV